VKAREAHLNPDHALMYEAQAVAPWTSQELS
jgi:hypothetical protein